MHKIRRMMGIAIFGVCAWGVAAAAAAEDWQASVGFNDKRVSSGSVSDWYPGFTGQLERNLTTMRPWNVSVGGLFIYGSNSQTTTIPIVVGTSTSLVTAESSDKLTYYLGTIRITQNSMGVAPFGQLGVGLAHWGFSDTYAGTTVSGSENAFAFDLQGGLCKAFNSKFHGYGAIGYSHASFSEGANAVRFNLGIRYMF